MRVFDYATRIEKFRFYAYETSFIGGVRVGDRRRQRRRRRRHHHRAPASAAGRESGSSAAWTASVISDYFAYEPDFRGGVFVAAGDVTGDGKADIITGTEVGGGPRITVFDGATGNVVQDFFAFDEAQRGGVRISSADLQR